MTERCVSSALSHQDMKLDKKSILLYGQSVGTGPTVRKLPGTVHVIMSALLLVAASILINCSALRLHHRHG